ncbi:type IV secretion protein VirB11 [Puniceibacterium antarcticum]|uniref:Type IV secretion system protein n=1 Tax=Puniceibacterium antarcticum TaxID=1206336 RepID=A0A2G8RA03_9RHOB|nr:type IV secretion protein VirB11 [Puniceibacterium antarcticum]
MDQPNIPSQKTVPPALASHLAPLARYLERDDVLEICINRPGEVFVEDTVGGWEQIAAPELSYSFLQGFVATVGTFSRQQVNETTPLLSGSLPQGERIQIVCPPAVPAGAVSITIRKPAQRSFSLDDLLGQGMFAEVENAPTALSAEDAALLELHRAKDWRAFLHEAVLAKKNILVSGSTGSGKTTFSKALIPLIPAQERLLTIEDTVELELPQPNVVRMIYSKGGQGEAQVTVRDLLESALRMRPDRIFLQELRDASAFYYLRNVNTGHGGSITTIHAESAALAFEQLALLVKESDAGRDLKRNEIKDMLYQMVDVVVQITKTEAGRRVREVYFDPSRKLAQTS